MDYPFIDSVGVGEGAHHLENYLHSPYVICVRAPSLSTAELLRTLGAAHLRAAPRGERGGRSLYVLRDDEWVVAADDWWYCLWRDPDKPGRLRALAEHGELVAFAMGDCCESYDLWRFYDGELVRRRVVESPHYNDRVVTVDEGEWASYEDEALYTLDASLIRRRVLSAHGVELARMRIEHLNGPSPPR